MRRVIAIALGCAAILCAVFAKLDFATAVSAASHVSFTPCHVEGVKEELRCGVYNVFENRQTRRGRMLPLKIVLIRARHPHPDQGPVFYMAGGPGETATELAELIMEQGDADEHDVLLVDERGTGDGHRLDCKSPGSDDNLEAYLNGPFDAAAARACRDDLQKKYDLSQYTTPNFADDIDEVGGAMGYNKININAGSFYSQPRALSLAAVELVLVRCDAFPLIGVALDTACRHDLLRSTLAGSLRASRGRHWLSPSLVLVI